MAEYKKTYKRGSTNQRNQESTEVRTFGGEMKPLMSESEKAEAQVLELSYDFSCRIIRLYKYLNEGKLMKMVEDRVEKFKRLMEMCEKYKRVNQFQ